MNHATTWVLLSAAIAFAGCAGKQARQQAAAQPRVLVFTSTAGYRHDSIPAGIAAVRALASEHGFAVECSEDERAFTEDRLSGFKAVMFLNTSGDVLDLKQQDGLQRFVEQGGGFIGVHAAADTEHDWEWFGKLLGARFRSHPAIQSATIDVINRDHPSTRRLPAQWKRTDEWYDFNHLPTGSTILARVDESTYQGGAMGADHPIAWCRQIEKGRIWYTAMGHTNESYREPEFLHHLLGGIKWAARIE